MKLRPAVESDLPGILAIYNHAILTSTALYNHEPQTLAMRHAWFALKKASGMPVFVIEDADGIAGFGDYGLFKTWTGQHYSIEHSIYVSETKRRLGYGKLLLSTLIEAATEQGMHTMIAGVDSQNEASIHLHLSFGFTQVAHFKEVGRKFDRWLDLLFFQKFLDSPNKPDSK